MYPGKGTTIYNVMVQEGEERQRAINKFKFVNKWFVIPLYRAYILPLFGIGWVILLLYTIGRKSGKRRITPLEYRKYGRDLLLFSTRGVYADWFLNLKENPDKVKIKRGFRTFKPEVQIIEDLGTRIEKMRWYAKSFPRAAKLFFGYSGDESDLTNENLKKMVEFLQIVKLRLPK